MVDFFAGLRGTLHVTFEEGSQSAWLYDVVQRHVRAGGGMQSAQECAAEGGQQERSDRCSQTGRIVARRHAVAGVSREQSVRTAAVNNWGQLCRADRRHGTRIMDASRPCIAAMRLLAPARNPTARAVAKTTRRICSSRDCSGSCPATVKSWIYCSSSPRSRSRSAAESRGVRERVAALRSLAGFRFGLRCSSPGCRHRIGFAETPVLGLLRAGTGDAQQRPTIEMVNGGRNGGGGRSYSVDYLNHNHDLENLFEGPATTASGSGGVLGGFYEPSIKGMKARAGSAHPGAQDCRRRSARWKKGEPFDAECVELMRLERAATGSSGFLPRCRSR